MEFIGRANQLTKLDALWRKRTASSGSWCDTLDAVAPSYEFLKGQLSF